MKIYLTWKTDFWCPGYCLHSRADIWNEAMSQEQYSCPRHTVECQSLHPVVRGVFSELNWFGWAGKTIESM